MTTFAGVCGNNNTPSMVASRQEGQLLRQKRATRLHLGVKEKMGRVTKKGHEVKEILKGQFKF